MKRTVFVSGVAGVVLGIVCAAFDVSFAGSFCVFVVAGLAVGAVGGAR